MENRSTDANVRGTAGFLCPTGAARALKDGLVGEPLAVLGPEVQAKLGESVERSAELSYINPARPSNGWLPSPAEQVARV